jgi:alkylhydroperoxidase family enzyme
MFLGDPPLDAAVAAAYETAAAEDGYVMNYVRGWAWRPDVAAAFVHARQLLATTTSLSARDVAVVNAVVASSREDAGCAAAWGTRLADETSPETAAAVLRGAHDALDARCRALASWAALVARDPNAVSAADVQRLRDVGLDDRTIAEATMLAAFRLAFTAFNDALGVEVDNELIVAASPEVGAAAALGRAASAR